jgi:Leucine-rich repeat (LRR) protein
MPGIFENMSIVENLELGHNRIEKLESYALHGLVNLKYISLEGNELQYLHPDTFVGLTNLQILQLSENPGLQVPTDRNFINSHSMKHLVISHCNVISVSVQTFANVSALEGLDLSNNNLKSLDKNVFKVLPNLSNLYLKLKQISEVIPGTCEKISPLEYFDLEDNIIEHLESDVFCGLVNLKYIHLQFNKLYLDN